MAYLASIIVMHTPNTWWRTKSEKFRPGERRGASPIFWGFFLGLLWHHPYHRVPKLLGTSTSSSTSQPGDSRECVQRQQWTQQWFKVGHFQYKSPAATDIILRNALIKGQVQIQETTCRKSKTKLLVTGSGSKVLKAYSVTRDVNAACDAPSAISGEPAAFGFCALTSCCSRQELKYRLESRPGYQHPAWASSSSQKALAESRELYSRQSPAHFPASSCAAHTSVHRAHQRGPRPPPSAAGTKRAFLRAAAAEGHGWPRIGSHSTPGGGGKAGF